MRQLRRSWMLSAYLMPANGSARSAKTSGGAILPIQGLFSRGCPARRFASETGVRVCAEAVYFFKSSAIVANCSKRGFEIGDDVGGDDFGGGEVGAFFEGFVF